MAAPAPRSFEPPNAVTLAPPKNNAISLAELSTADGSDPKKVWVAIKGTVFDVTGNMSYIRGGSYNVFAGKDGSRGLAKSSVKPEDATAQLGGLSDKELGVLDDWFVFFSKRYNILGHVV